MKKTLLMLASCFMASYMQAMMTSKASSVAARLKEINQTALTAYKQLKNNRSWENFVDLHAKPATTSNMKRIQTKLTPVSPREWDFYRIQASLNTNSYASTRNALNDEIKQAFPLSIASFYDRSTDKLKTIQGRRDEATSLQNKINAAINWTNFHKSGIKGSGQELAEINEQVKKLQEITTNLDKLSNESEELTKEQLDELGID